jgi:hypothetical protein
MCERKITWNLVRISLACSCMTMINVITEEQNPKSFMEIDSNQMQNILCKSKITNIVAVRIFEVISDKLNTDECVVRS